MFQKNILAWTRTQPLLVTVMGFQFSSPTEVGEARGGEAAIRSKLFLQAIFLKNYSDFF